MYADQSLRRVFQRIQMRKCFFSGGIHPTPSPPPPSLQTTQQQESLQLALNHVRGMVQRHDPAGSLAGRLLNTNDMRMSYYAVRSFWVETGLRFGTTAMVPPHSTPHEHWKWWEQGVDRLYGSMSDEDSAVNNHLEHPTLKLLASLHKDHNFSRCHFDDILKGRALDLELKQYPDMKALEDHAERSCGSLMQLILESDGVREEDYPVSHEAAKLLGKAHGLTNALRTSIPVMSTTGKLVIPQELCTKYGVRTPRYLLSALGQGDVECIQALQMAVQDISNRALDFLQQARDLRPQIQHEAGGDAITSTKSKDIMGVFLPGLASETFLKRLQHHNFDLTNRNLRNVSALEHARCSIRMIYASWSQQY